jgi:hypothetical protein
LAKGAVSFQQEAEGWLLAQGFDSLAKRSNQRRSPERKAPGSIIQKLAAKS